MHVICGVIRSTVCLINPYVSLHSLQSHNECEYLSKTTENKITKRYCATCLELWKFSLFRQIYTNISVFEYYKFSLLISLNSYCQDMHSL